MLGAGLHARQVRVKVAKLAALQSHGFEQAKRLARALHKGLLVAPFLPFAFRARVCGNAAANAAARIKALQSDGANRHIEGGRAAGLHDA